MSYAKYLRIKAAAHRSQARAYRLQAKAERSWSLGNPLYAEAMDVLQKDFEQWATDADNEAAALEKEGDQS